MHPPTCPLAAELTSGSLAGAVQGQPKSKEGQGKTAAVAAIPRGSTAEVVEAGTGCQMEEESIYLLTWGSHSTFPSLS